MCVYVSLVCALVCSSLIVYNYFFYTVPAPWIFFCFALIFFLYQEKQKFFHRYGRIMMITMIIEYRQNG